MEPGPGSSDAPDAWRERQVARMVEADDSARPLRRGEAVRLVAGVLVVWVVALVGLALLTGNGGAWPWAVLVAVVVTAISAGRMLGSQATRRRAAERRARRIVGTWERTNNPWNSGGGG